MSRLPPGWAGATLGEVCEPVAKWNPDDAPNMHFEYIDIGGIAEHRIAETKTYSGREAPSRARQLVRAGDTVLSTVRTYLRKTALVPAELDNATASTGFCVLRGSIAASGRYIFYRVIAHDFVARLSARQTGSSYPAVRDRDVFNEEIELPPLAEQLRIVAAIEEQFSRLDATSRVLQATALRLEGLRRAVLDTTFRAETRTRLLGEVADTKLGKMLSAKSKVGQQPLPYLRNKSVQWYRIDVDDLPTMDFSDSERAKFRLSCGDVLICEGGEVGRAGVWRGQLEECYFQKALHRVRTGAELDPEFLVHVFRWFADRDAFEPYVTGSTIKHLPQEDLRRLPVPVPPLEEQRRIVAEIDQQLSLIDSLRAAVESAQRRSAALRRTILERAFRGELVPQDPADEPASVLLERIRAERDAAPPARRARTARAGR